MILVAAVVVLVATGVDNLGAGRATAAGTSTGAVSAFGDATAYGAPPADRLNSPVVAIASTPDGEGYWLVGADGGIFTQGDASFSGSEGDSGILTPFVGITPTPDGRGYWIAAIGSYANNFGDAPGESGLSVIPYAPMVGVAATPTGAGYWLAGADGGVFTQGDAGFRGSMAATRLAAPVVGIAPTHDGGGYWLVAADGGVFSFGDATFHGSLGATPASANTPVVAIAATPDGGGYWLTTTDKSLPPPTPVPSVLADCNQPGASSSVKPSSISLACADANAVLDHLRWSSWTATTATATGNFTHNTCTPNCAQGTFVSDPATVALSYPVQTSAGRQFATVSYTTANSTFTGVVATSPG